MEEEISLLDLWQIIKEHIYVIFISSLVGVLLAAAYAFVLATPIYQSSTEILVNQSESKGQNNTLNQDINASLQLINTYSDVIRNEVVLSPVIDQLNLQENPDQLREKISVESKNNSQVFSIIVNDPNPERAATIANTTAEVFQKAIRKMMNIDNVSIISKAQASHSPVSPRKALALLIGLVLGMGVGLVIAFIHELTDNTVKDVDFLTKEIGWNMLGRVSELSENDLKVTYKANELQQIYHPDQTQGQERRRERV
ncbi:YveK family protein [Aerococcus urinae]